MRVGFSNQTLHRMGKEAGALLYTDPRPGTTFETQNYTQDAYATLRRGCYPPLLLAFERRLKICSQLSQSWLPLPRSERIASLRYGQTLGSPANPERRLL